MNDPTDYDSHMIHQFQDLGELVAYLRAVLRQSGDDIVVLRLALADAIIAIEGTDESEGER